MLDGVEPGFHEESGHADDAVHGGPDFVADVGEELAFCGAGGFGLDGEFTCSGDGVFSGGDGDGESFFDAAGDDEEDDGDGDADDEAEEEEGEDGVALGVPDGGGVEHDEDVAEGGGVDGVDADGFAVVVGDGFRGVAEDGGVVFCVCLEVSEQLWEGGGGM